MSKNVLFSKKTKKDVEKSPFLQIGEELIPYATHLSEETIITKNFQLLQTIKIGNFAINLKNGTLRDFIRNAVIKNVKSDDFALWFHTVRKKVNLTGVLHAENDYVKFASKKWNEYNNFKEEFINEVYITILIKGPEIKDKDVVTKYFTHKKLKNFTDEAFLEKEIELTQVVEAILLELSPYSPRKLQIVKRGEAYFSENIEFLHKILNLCDLECEVEEADLSSQLAISKKATLFNKIELENDFQKESIAVLTLKHYSEITPNVLDKILSLPFEFTIFQTFDFVNMVEVVEKYSNQYKMLTISKDFNFITQLGINEQDVLENEFKYGKSQISIILSAGNEAKVEEDSAKIAGILSEIGFVCIREDIMIEDAFFSTLPANFYFLNRMQPIQVNKIAGFTSIDSYPTGKLQGNTWGEALCIFKTTEGQPFFFNFHNASGFGHTIFIGKQFDIQKNAIINFLQLNSLKFSTRIINIDFTENTKLFNAFVGGVYKELSLEPSDDVLKLNPLLLKNEGDLEIFFKNLLKLDENENENTVKYLKEKLLPFLSTRKNEFKNVEEILALIKAPKITDVFFKNIATDGVFGHIFAQTEDDILNFDGQMLSINISKILESVEIKTFFLEYLLATLKQLTSDKKKTIIKIDNFLEHCIESGFSREKIADILKTFKENNVVLMMSESYHFFQEAEKQQEDDKIFKMIATQVYTPAFVNYGFEEIDMNNNYLNKVGKFAHLHPYEKELLLDVSFEETIFTVKHEGKIISLEFNPNFSTFLYFFLASRGIESGVLIGLNFAENFEERLAEAKALHQILFES